MTDEKQQYLSKRFVKATRISKFLDEQANELLLAVYQTELEKRTKNE